MRLGLEITGGGLTAGTLQPFKLPLRNALSASLSGAVEGVDEQEIVSTEEVRCITVPMQAGYHGLGLGLLIAE
jgi:hypothetical protein